MVVCTNCGYENPAGEVFCQKCGVALGAISLSTAQLGEADDDHAAGSEYLSEDHVVLLHIAKNPDPIALQVDKEIVIGRESGDGFLNVESFDAVNMGVSRRHAALRPKQDRLVIVDLQSTNRSYLNGNALTPDEEYPIRDGDELTLGKLPIRVFFK